jgi:hypothetical protein
MYEIPRLKCGIYLPGKFASLYPYKYQRSCKCIQLVLSLRGLNILSSTFADPLWCCLHTSRLSQEYGITVGRHPWGLERGIKGAQILASQPTAVSTKVTAGFRKLPLTPPATNIPTRNSCRRLYATTGWYQEESKKSKRQVENHKDPADIISVRQWRTTMELGRAWHSSTWRNRLSTTCTVSCMVPVCNQPEPAHSLAGVAVQGSLHLVRHTSTSLPTH